MKEFKISTSSITSRDSICISNYLREVRRIDLLTPDEEAHLARIIKKGGREGQKAKDALVMANLRFVISVAKSFRNSGLELSDLISEGNLGLMKAAETFDETRGFRFLTFAVWWIRQSINNAIMNKGGVVRIPSNQHRVFADYLDMQEEVMQTEGRELSLDEYAEMSGISVYDLTNIMKAARKANSLDAKFGDDSDTTYLDMLTSGSKTDRSMDMESLSTDLNRVITSVLTDKEAYVLCHHFGIACPQETFDVIAAEIGLSRERTRQLNMKAVEKLRKSAKALNLLNYLAA